MTTLWVVILGKVVAVVVVVVVVVIVVVVVVVGDGTPMRMKK